MSRLRRRRGRGFVLIEVLVSFTILALVLAAVLAALSSGMRAVGASGEYTSAVLVARSKLEEIRAADDVESAELSGVVRDSPVSGSGNLYHWRVTVGPYEAEPELDFERLPVTPMTIGVEVSWSDGGKPRSVALTTLHLARER